MRAGIARAVRRRPVPTARHAFEHVADVAHERVRVGGNVDPARGRPHLQAAGRVLEQHGEQSVVGVLPDTPGVAVRRLGRRRVVEDAEEDDRVAREVASEPIGVEAETERDAPHHVLTQRAHRFEILEHRVAQPGRPPRELVRTVEREPVAHARIVGLELGPEVDALLPVGNSGRELPADGEPSPPGAPAVHHRDPGLLGVVEREELPRVAIQARAAAARPRRG